MSVPVVSSIILDPYSIEKSPEVTSLAMVIFAADIRATLQIGYWTDSACGSRAPQVTVSVRIIASGQY